MNLIVPAIITAFLDNGVLTPARMACSGTRYKTLDLQLLRRFLNEEMHSIFDFLNTLITLIYLRNTVIGLTTPNAEMVAKLMSHLFLLQQPLLPLLSLLLKHLRRVVPTSNGNHRPPQPNRHLAPSRR
jgi:hypothetical protein